MRATHDVLLDRRNSAGVSGRDRLAAGETFALAMPEPDAVLAQPPAPEYVLAVQPAGKIDQADIEILHHAADRFDLFDRCLDFFGGAVEALAQRARPVGADREAAGKLRGLKRS